MQVSILGNRVKDLRWSGCSQAGGSIPVLHENPWIDRSDRYAQSINENFLRLTRTIFDEVHSTFNDRNNTLSATETLNKSKQNMNPRRLDVNNTYKKSITKRKRPYAKLLYGGL